MSEVRLIIRDAEHSICGNAHGSFADRVIAALSAEPETIEELEAALIRFQRPCDHRFFGWLRAGADDSPWDAGVVMIDLAARLVVCNSSYSSLAREGYVEYHDGTQATDKLLRYHVPDDWQFTSWVESWHGLAQHRRSNRAAHPPIDTRAVLYGAPLLEFLGAQSWLVFSDTAEPKRCGASATGLDSEESDRMTPEEEQARNAVQNIHARWLTTPREELGGRTPRDVLHEKRKFIEWDMQDRCEQWTRLDECPAELAPASHAYRFAGYGIHEMVMYYDLVRHLLWESRNLCTEVRASGRSDAFTVGDFLATAVPRLEGLRDEWLDAPDGEFHGRTPRSIIERERRRLPEVMSRHELVIDDDCPLCAMAADMPGPTFWHLDGCNMDDDFAFSIFHRTREEWQEEERSYQEFNRKFAAREAERERLGVEYPRGGYGDPDQVWQRSFVAPESEETSLVMRVFAVGFSLSELICDLKEPVVDHDLDPVDRRNLIDRLSRDFGNLREVAQSEDVSVGLALTEPVLNSFCEALEAVSAAREDLRPKCANLQERLRRFSEPPTGGDDATYGPDDDVPW